VRSPGGPTARTSIATAPSAPARAEAEHRERLRDRAENLQALAAAHPVGHFDRLGVHVLQAVALHLLDGPSNRRFEIGRAAEAMTERVAEVRQPLPGGVGRERFPHQTPGRVAVRGEPRHRRSLRDVQGRRRVLQRDEQCEGKRANNRHARHFSVGMR
jgi:hypothetical protein